MNKDLIPSVTQLQVDELSGRTDGDICNLGALEAAAAVAPGSDLHVFLALRALSLQQQQQQQQASAGGSAESMNSAFQHLVHSLSMRYGLSAEIDQGKLQELCSAASRALSYISPVDLLIPVQVADDDAEWDEEEEEA